MVIGREGSNIFLKGTVSVISSGPHCKEGNAQFTKVPLKALFDPVWMRYPCFSFFKQVFLFAVSLQKRLTYFFHLRSNGECKHFWSQENDGILHIFNKIVVNQALTSLHEGSLSVPLNADWKLKGGQAWSVQ